MRYVVLLRGINVGGNTKISMAELKTALEKVGFIDVKTYINSGNILLSSKQSTNQVNALVEHTITKTFSQNVPTITISSTNFLQMSSKLPADWNNDKETKCYCLFLRPAIDSLDILTKLNMKPNIDHVLYYSGVVFWYINRKDESISGLSKIIGTDIYKQITVRNSNTMRKLANMLSI